MAAEQGWFSSGVPSAYRDLRYDYEPMAEQVWSDAGVRNRQQAAQQATRMNQPVGRGTFTSLVNRGQTDINVARAKQDQEAKRLWSQQQSQIPVAPSTASQFVSPLMSGLGYGLATGKGMGGDLWSGAKSLGSSAWSKLGDFGGSSIPTSAPADYYAGQYNTLRGQGLAEPDFPSSAWGSEPSAYAEPDFPSSAWGSEPSAYAGITEGAEEAPDLLTSFFSNLFGGLW